MKAYAVILAACLAASCDAPHADDHSGEQGSYAEHFPPPGSNEMLRARSPLQTGLK